MREQERNMSFEPFTDHSEIDSTTESYILQVADAKSIWQIPLEDINSFLEGLEEYHGQYYR